MADKPRHYFGAPALEGDWSLCGRYRLVAGEARRTTKRDADVSCYYCRVAIRRITTGRRNP